MSGTIYVCGKCGRTADDMHVRGWLIGSAKNAEKVGNGEMVIRCPEHVTRYAIRQVELGRKAIRN